MLGTTNTSENNTTAIAKIDRDLGYASGSSDTVKSDLDYIKNNMPGGDCTITYTYKLGDASYPITIIGLPSSSSTFSVKNGTLMTVMAKAGSSNYPTPSRYIYFNDILIFSDSASNYTFTNSINFVFSITSDTTITFKEEGSYSRGWKGVVRITQS